MSTTRELVEQSAEILARANRARRDADAMFDELKRMDAAITRRKEEAAAQRKREEQIRVQSTHSRAFTMLDDEEKAQVEAAMRENREKAGRTEKEGAEQPVPEETPAPKPAEKQPEPEAEKPAPAAKPETAAAEKAPEKPAEAAPAQAEAPAAAKQPPKEAAKPAERPAQQPAPETGRETAFVEGDVFHGIGIEGGEKAA